MRESIVASSIRPHQTFHITLLPDLVFLMKQMLVCNDEIFAEALLLIKLVGRGCFSVAEEQAVSTPFRAIGSSYVVDEFVRRSGSCVTRRLATVTQTVRI